MPTYVYKFVDSGETIEVQQGFHDENLTKIAHPESGEVLPVKKVFTPVGVTFKGSGFFKTDNRGKKSAAPTAPSGTKDSKDTSSSSGDKSSSSSDSGSSSGSTSTSKTESSSTSKTESSSTSSSASSSSD